MNRSRLVGLVALLVGVTAVVTSVGSAASSGSSPGRSALRLDSALVKRLQASARGSVTVRLQSSTRFAAFVRAGRNGDLLPRSTSRTPSGKALGFLGRYGAIFGVRNARSELVRTGTLRDRYGTAHVSYRQVYKGVPVFGAVLRAHFDARRNLTAVNGAFVPGLKLSVKPKLTRAQATRRAIAFVIAHPTLTERTADSPSARPVGLRAASTKLYVYRIGLIRGVPGSNQLVYRVLVTNGRDVRDVVFVHANAGKIVNRYSEINDALFRRLFEMDLSNQVWQEGDPFPGALNVDQQNIVNFSGHSYYHFFNAFGRDSYDGAGAEMQSINNDPTINCPNANWNGATTNYCTGVTGDDTVAHEWGHAYTQFTHNLIYQWQPGALNEAYSDIWGEVVDLINLQGTDEPGPVRSDLCSDFTTPIPVLTINSPASIAGDCAAAGAAFGPTLTETGITGSVVVGLDPADEAGPSTTDACSPLTNADAVNGNIALVDRGTCAFTVKVKNAQNAGAVAVVVANNVVGPPSPMGGADPTITISSVMISMTHGNMIKGELALGNPVNVTMKLGGGETEASYRWLSGEDDPAFGGAIRDMWKPTCLGDPGKVTDSEYHCSTADNGGVHTNSGVPNHGFALLVDGGTYNDQTIGALGLVKAAHLYWRAQSVYQTPASGFPEHADALEASCTDLIGQNLEGLSTSPIPAGLSGEIISAADCVEVSDMIAAVELHSNPAAQCNFQPLLAKNPPALCAGTENSRTHFLEDFEDGLTGWTLRSAGVFAGWPGLRWQQDTSLPGGRAGAAAFATDPDIGNCDQGAGDISGVMQMVSPAIDIPATATLGPRLTWEHYLATEIGFDGGNVKISINGGPFSAGARLRVPVQSLQHDARYRRRRQHQPARRRTGVHRHGRRPRHRELGSVAGRPHEDRCQAGRPDPDSLRLRHGRLRRHRRLVRRRRRGQELQQERGRTRDRQAGLSGTDPVDGERPANAGLSYFGGLRDLAPERRAAPPVVGEPLPVRTPTRRVGIVILTKPNPKMTALRGHGRSGGGLLACSKAPEKAHYGPFAALGVRPVCARAPAAHEIPAKQHRGRVGGRPGHGDPLLARLREPSASTGRGDGVLMRLQMLRETRSFRRFLTDRSISEAVAKQQTDP